MKSRNALPVLSAALLLASPAQAIQINWGSSVDSVFRDSMGVPLDETYKIQLGYFMSVLGEDPFVPDATNTASWADHWVVFDQAAFDPESGYFTSSVLLNGDGSSSSSFADLGVDFSNQQAYIWTYNSDIPGSGSEWFLATSASWVIPEKLDDCCDDRLPLEWSIDDLGAGDTPVYGKHGGFAGAGEFSVTGTYDMQTFTFVPEPSSAILLVMGVGSLVLRRRRSGMTKD